MSVPFTIDIWSDVVCPFCYLGERQLARALEQFEHRDDVIIAHHAFELDPRAKLSCDRPLAELVARKYDMPVERAESLHHQLETEAAALGMTWSLSTAQPTNTFDAHRLIALATDQGRGAAAVERLFSAYFVEGLLVSDHDTLCTLASDVGVSGAAELLASDERSDEVRDDEEAAMELGISGVPSMVLDGKFMVSGAQGVETFLELLRRAWARRG